MSIFLIDVAEFNKQLNANVRGFFRNIGGKIIPVKSHSRRYVMATRQALKDLQQKGKSGFEVSYLINPKTGYVGDHTIGTSEGVDPYGNMRFKHDFEDMTDYVAMGQKSQRHVLHNHPVATSLSSIDIFHTTPRNQIYAINETGSIFRGYKLKDYDMDLHSAQTLEIFAEMAEKYPNAKQTELGFLASHLANKKMQNEGLIFYRSKLSKTDHKTINKYKSFVDDVLQKPLYDMFLPIGSNASDATVGKLKALESLELFNILKRSQIGNLSKKQKRELVKKYIEDNVYSYQSLQRSKKDIERYKDMINSSDRSSSDYWLESLAKEEEKFRNIRSKVKQDIKKSLDDAKRYNYFK